jgi:lysozyme
MKTNQEGIDLIKKFEGFRATPYLCPAGYATIGYGHVITDARGNQLRNLAAARQYEPVAWSPRKAEDILGDDLRRFELAVDGLLGRPYINENEFAALVSFAYNLGTTALAKSTLLKKVRAGDKKGASAEFMKWVYAGRPKRVLPGLVKRRGAERRLFLTPAAPVGEPEVCRACGAPADWAAREGTGCPPT